MENETMGKYRNVNTDFWIDIYIDSLVPEEKLLYLYFLTCPNGNLCGCYQINIKHVSVDTGLKVDFILKTLSKFELDKKIIYKDNWIGIKNFIKHQQTNNVKIKSAINQQIKAVPDFILSFINDLSIGHQCPMDVCNDNDNDNESDNDNKNDIEKEFFEKFNAKMPVKIAKMTEERKKTLKKRFKDAYFKENWIKALEIVPTIPFLNGTNKREWKADFDFFMRPDSVAKIIEGKYGKAEEPQIKYGKDY